MPWSIRIEAAEGRARPGLGIESGGVDGRRGGARRRLVAAAEPLVEQPLRHRPIDQAGIQEAQTVAGGQAARQRALAGGGRTVDGNDDRPHGARSWIAQPRPFMSSAKPGKLVKMVSAPATATGAAPSPPSTKKLMAMRWS